MSRPIMCCRRGPTDAQSAQVSARRRSWGIAPAVIAAIASVGASAFFFYPPIYSFLVHDPQHLVELPLFVFVAIVTGHLATNLRRQADLARRREIEVHDLHVLSRRLAAAHTPGDIHIAIRQHLAAIIGHRTILLETVPRGGAGATFNEETVPELIRRATEAIATGNERSSGSVDDDEGHVWMVRKIFGKTGDFGILAIDLGRQAGRTTDVIRERVDAALADATITLEHLDLDHAIADARSLRNRGIARCPDRLGLAPIAHAARSWVRRRSWCPPQAVGMKEFCRLDCGVEERARCRIPFLSPC
jgi:two-component system sensor histidine kinase KdpD